MKIEITTTDNLTEFVRSLAAKLGFGIALCAPSLRSIEADKPNVRFRVVNADCVTINDMNLIRLNRLGVGDGDDSEPDYPQLK